MWARVLRTFSHHSSTATATTTPPPATATAFASTTTTGRPLGAGASAALLDAAAADFDLIPAGLVAGILGYLLGTRLLYGEDGDLQAGLGDKPLARRRLVHSSN